MRFGQKITAAMNCVHPYYEYEKYCLAVETNTVKSNKGYLPPDFNSTDQSARRTNKFGGSHEKFYDSVNIYKTCDFLENLSHDTVRTKV